MEYKVKESVMGDFAQKGEDIKTGDLVTIKDEGKQIEGQYGTQDIFTIETRNGEKLASFNQTSLNALVTEFGGSSASWVGKEVQVIAIKQNVQGKFVDVYYFVPDGYEMGERGFTKLNIPTINVDEKGEEEIQMKDIPF